MARKLTRASLLVLGLWMISVPLSAPLWAHHGGAAYDSSKSLVVKGTITDWIWANPHCWLKFDAKDDKGSVAHWTAEVSNPSDMVDRGWSKFTFKPGDEVTITMHPMKNGQPIGRITQVMLANGQTLKN